MNATAPLEQQAQHPRGISRRELIVGGALASAGLLSAALRHQTSNAMAPALGSLEDVVPEDLGRWNRSPISDTLIPTGETPEDSYDDVLTRHYSPQGGGAPVLLLVAYGNAQTGNAQLHRPEACYPAAGFALSDARELPLKVPGAPEISAVTLTATAPGRIEQILYWSRIGTRFPTSSAAQRWAAFRQTLDGSAPDGALVRISTINAGDEALPTLRSFASALLTHRGSRLQQLLTGRA